MGTGFFEKKPGEKSMMRLVVFLTFVICSIIATTGAVLLIAVIFAMIGGNGTIGSVVGQLILLIGTSLGIIAGSEAFKALQQRGETIAEREAREQQ